jgi:hypothetical protein
MSSSRVVPDPLAERLSLIRTHLDQRAWRLLLGAEAKVLGRGGIKTVAAATGAHPDTVAQGVRELDECDTLIWPRRASLKWPHPRSTSP